MSGSLGGRLGISSDVGVDPECFDLNEEADTAEGRLTGTCVPDVEGL